MMPEATVEITTRIGCPINCLKYCPQELIVSRYGGGSRVLSFEQFAQMISTVPKEVPIVFAGFVEPFANSSCAAMILHAHAAGHKIQVYSTLVGLSADDADLLFDTVTFQKFALHLPDAEKNANIPVTPEYLAVLGKVLSKVRNLSFMNMGHGFVSNGCEHMARGTVAYRKTGRLYCELLYYPNFQVLPNGETFFCCMTRGITERVGNLAVEPYQMLINRFPKQSYRLQTDSSSICHVCNNSYPHWIRRLETIKKNLLGTKKLSEILGGKVRV
jgi:hypothetical protein